MKAASIRFAFFGTGRIAAFVLEELLDAGLAPALIITAPDARQGRGMEVSESLVAKDAKSQNIPTRKYEKLNAAAAKELSAEEWDIFVVCDYGFLIPQSVIDIPKRGILNMHPSLLPRLRGPSPIRSAILEDERDTGVSIMLLDADLDHGPVIAQKKVAIDEWPPYAIELEEDLARAGGELLAQMLPMWIADEIEARPQNHDLATYTEKFEKSDGEIDLSSDAYKNLLKIRAFEGWPGTFAYFQKGGKKLRVKILDAHMESGRLVIDRVLPEGKREMPYADFAASGATPIASE